MKFFLFCFLISFNLCKLANASVTTYVICVNQNKDWKWLSNWYGHYETVNGKWKSYVKKNKIQISLKKSFYLSGENKKYEELNSSCLKRFGPGYFPQPADRYSSQWYVFMTETGIQKGFLDIMYIPIAFPTKSELKTEFIKEPFDYKKIMAMEAFG